MLAARVKYGVESIHTLSTPLTVILSLKNAR